MNRAVLVVVAVAAFLTQLASPAVAAGPEHPRLFVSAADVPALRKKVTVEPFASMFARLKQDFATNNWGSGPSSGAGYDVYMEAHRYAFAYLCTGNAEYAAKAGEIVEKIIADKNWANARTKGLTLYNAGTYVAIVYDHCYPAWDEPMRKKVSAAIRKQADVVLNSGGSEQNNSPASNWKGLRYSSAGLMYMATDEEGNFEKPLAAAHAGVKRYLTANLGTDPKARGWNLEGLGYTFYPMGNGVCPYAVAAARRDPALDLRKEVAPLAWTLWTTYATSVQTPMGLLRPDFGDDNPGTNGEGCYGFAFYFCPDEIKPGLKYWYDRTVGSKGNKTYDNGRFGTVSSILFYPAELPEKDPMTIAAWREAFLDTKGAGYFTFRNQYKDSSDLVAQLYVKLRGNQGHSGPDALSFRIAGLGTLWGTGGGRYGPKAGGMDVYLRSMNTLYPVDPDTNFKTSGASGKVVGQPTLSADGGGTIVARISTSNVGVKDHTRRMLTTFDQSCGAAAAMVLCDTSADGKFWQMVTLSPNTITTEGRTFTMTSPEGNTLKGTVIYPAGEVRMKTGKRARGSDAGSIKENNFVHVESGDGNFVVVLTLAAKGKSHPAVTASGSWGASPSGTVTVGKFSATVDGESISGK